jgi:uncharacterized protein YuzE
MSATSIKIGPYAFDNIDYDAEVDVLYLHRGDPSTAVDFDDTPEGHGLRFGADGGVVGITLLHPRWLLEHDGHVTITLPVPQSIDVDAGALDSVLLAA